MSAAKRLQKLTTNRAFAPSQFTDLLCKSLNPSRFAGWRRVLSSIATTESYEGLVLEPILNASTLREARLYLQVHADDEQNHSNWVKQYLHNNFAFKKSKPTWSDKIFYETLLPGAAGLIRIMPIVGIAALYAYEQFSVRLYQKLRAQAQADGLIHLAAIFNAIQHDEGRHLAGLELIAAELTPVSKIKRWSMSALVPILLFLVRMDLYFGRWNILNRELATHIAKLGITPAEIDQDVLESVRITKLRMTRSRQSMIAQASMN